MPVTHDGEESTSIRGEVISRQENDRKRFDMRASETDNSRKDDLKIHMISDF